VTGLSYRFADQTKTGEKLEFCWDFAMRHALHVLPSQGRLPERVDGQAGRLACGALAGQGADRVESTMRPRFAAAMTEGTMRVRFCSALAGLTLLLASYGFADPPGGLALDWPLGYWDGSQYIPGYNVYVMQKYDVQNADYGNKFHAGVDLMLDQGVDATANAPVRAAADGVVTCTSVGVNYPGRVVVIEHALSDGSRLYTQYGHLNQTLFVSEGQLVNRGTLIGTVVFQTSNSHVHFEVRTFKNWKDGKCWGPGYAETGFHPSQQGWFNPINEYFNHRPSFPGLVISNSAVNLRNAPNRTGSTVIGQVPSNTGVTAYSVSADQGGTADWWYRVNYNGVWGYVNAYWDGVRSCDVYMTELIRDPGPVGLLDVVASGGQLHVFARASSGALKYRRRDTAGNWSGWQPLTGVLTSNPAVAVNADGRLEVFVRGADNALWHRWQYANGAWTVDWQPLNGVLTSPPAVGVNQDGRLQVFVRGTDGALWTRSQAVHGSSDWTDWDSLDGILHFPPVVAQNQDGRLDVFAVGIQNELWHIGQIASNGDFGEWEKIDGRATSIPSVVRDASGYLNLFVRAPDFSLQHVKQKTAGGSWGKSTPLGGILMSPPRAVIDRYGRLVVFVRGDNGRPRYLSQTVAGGSWSTAWGDLEGFMTSPIGVANQNGWLQAIVPGRDLTLWHRGQTSTGWTAYYQIGSGFAPYEASIR
jgi:murein DD-endopeptidase MepM/ murein hydrolase activator NlpD